jgi:hypothetical protein
MAHEHMGRNDDTFRWCDSCQETMTLTTNIVIDGMIVVVIGIITTSSHCY